MAILLVMAVLPFMARTTSLRGSPRKAKLQNQWADRANIKPIRSDKELAELKKSGQLVPLPMSAGITIDERLEPRLRFCRPETMAFFAAFGKSFYSTFASSFRVTSAVRTIPYQKALRKRNKNAAAAEGPEASSHLRGTTIDITKVGLTKKQVRWLRKNLGIKAAKGEIIVAEEFKQSVFHVMAKPISALPKKYLFLIPLVPH